MTSDYLSPLSDNVINLKAKLPEDSIGNKITLFDSNRSDYQDINIAILGINEYRNSTELK